MLGEGSSHITVMLIASENKKSIMLLLCSVRSQSTFFESKAPALASFC